MAWVRNGECNRCGECCVTGDPFVGQLGEASVINACPLFKYNEDGLGTCKVRTGEVLKSDNILIKNYTENGCELWPSIPEHISPYKNCSYTFEWVE